MPRYRLRDAGSANPAADGARQAAPDDARLVAALRKLVEARREAADDMERRDDVTGLPAAVQFHGDFTAAKAAGASAVMLVLAAADERLDLLLHAFGPALVDDFIRAAAGRLLEALPDGAVLYHVQTAGFAFFVAEDFERAPQAIVTGVQRAFCRPVNAGGVLLDAHVAIGIADIGDPRSESGRSLRDASASARAARGSVDSWTRGAASVDAAKVRRLRLVSDLPAAIRDGQVSLRYQPRITMQEQRCIGADARIHWVHPTFGEVDHREILDVAGMTAVALPLARMVVENGLRAAARWESERRSLKLWAALPAKVLDDLHFADLLMAMVYRFDVDPSALEFEFDEDALLAGPRSMLDQAARLGRFGLGIALGGFGGGASRMGLLGQLPARSVRIDRSLTGAISGDRKAQVLVRSVIEFAHSLGRTVVADDVSTREAFGLLCGWDCDEAQGPLIGPPAGLGDFARWSESRGLADFYEKIENRLHR